MQRTAHYDLPIFEADDHPSILTDFNQAMYDIDEAMFTISMGGSASAEAIEELRQGLASVSTQISAINQTLGTKLDDSFLNNLAPEFDTAEHYLEYNFVFKDGNLYQCIDEYDPVNDSFDNCFVAVWLCNNVARNQADIESLNGSVSRLDSEFSSLDGRTTSLDERVTSLESGGSIEKIFEKTYTASSSATSSSDMYIKGGNTYYDGTFKLAIYKLVGDIHLITVDLDIDTQSNITNGVNAYFRDDTITEDLPEYYDSTSKLRPLLTYSLANNEYSIQAKLYIHNATGYKDITFSTGQTTAPSSLGYVRNQPNHYIGMI